MAMAVYDVTGKPAAPLVGDRVLKIVRLTMDTDYADGGYSLDEDDLGLAEIDQVLIPPAGGFVFTYEYDTNKVKAWWGNNDAGADSALVQVPDGENTLDTVAVRALVIGSVA